MISFTFYCTYIQLKTEQFDAQYKLQYSLASVGFFYWCAVFVTQATTSGDHALFELQGPRISSKSSALVSGLNHLVRSGSSAGATWLSILSTLILCVASARFLNQDKKSGGRFNKYKKNIL